MTARGQPRTGAPTLAVVSVLATTVSAFAQAPAQPPLILDCTEFSKTTDEAALAKRFGRENVVAAKLEAAEGETVPGIAVYPKDPSRRLEISWADPDKRQGFGGIAIRGRSEWLVRTPGKARTTIGLRAGLEDMEDANERPFQINGFGWDYGGYASGWKGGKLDHMAGGCSFTARFNPDPHAKGKALDRVSGEKEFGSSDPALRAVRPFLSSIALDWPE